MAEQPSVTNHNSTNTGEHATAEGHWDESQGATSRLMSQEGVYQLTQDLRKFSDTLTSLKNVFCDEKDSREQSLRVAAHERLGELLKVLKSIVNKYEELNSTGILNAAESLINHIKTYNYEGAEEYSSPEIFSAINNLALAFSSSVSECLIGDINISPRQSNVAPSQYENVVLHQQSNQRQSLYDGVPEIAPVSAASDNVPTEPVMDAMAIAPESLDISFERAKAWSKYANDLLTYVKKKVHIELEYAKQLTKLSQTTRAVLSEQSFLPFQSLYCTALDNDKEYASNVNSTYQSMILTHKFVEPLQARRAEHDRQVKSYRDAWRKDKRRLEEAEANLKKAKQQYQTRNQEYQKAKEAAIRADQQLYSGGDGSHSRQGSGTSSSQLSQNVTAGASLGIIPTTKVERKRKEENESYLKAMQAEQLYRACVNEANQRRKELEEKEEKLLKSLRDLMTQCDQTTKTVTLNFFSLHCDLASPILVQHQALLEESKIYEPGFKYSEYLRHVTPQHHPEVRQDYRFESCATEGAAYVDHNTAHQKENPHEDSSPLPNRAFGGRLHGRRTSQRGISDTESSSSRSLDDLSPSASPGDHTNRKDINKRRPSTEGSLSSEEILDEGKDNEQPRHSGQSGHKDFASNSPDSSPAPQQRQLPKMMKMVANVKEAFRGMKKTTKSSIFGVDFAVAVQDTHDGIPLLVKKCIAEIDNRALTVKGIYRVNGVKNRVEKLCSLLDSPQCARADLSEQLPHDVSGVLKYFLRQLPEPLMQHRLYNDFLAVGKEYSEIVKQSKPQNTLQNAADGDLIDVTTTQTSSELLEQDLMNKLMPVVDQMRAVVDELPQANRDTLQYIIAHLSRVAEHQSENKMSASNLAIIFGPTLLRATPSGDESGQQLQALIELPSQSQAVEMLITHRNKIFETYTQKAHIEEVRDQMRSQNSVDTPDEVQTVNHDLDPPTATQYPKLLPLNSEPQSVTTVPATSIDENLQSFDEGLLSNDNHSTSGTSSSGDLFSIEEINARFGQKDSVSGDSSQTGQSNGGMNVIDDGRTVIPHCPGLRKSSSSRNIAQGGLTPANNVRNLVRDDFSVGPSSTKARPSNGSAVDNGIPGITTVRARPGTLATNQTYPPPTGHPSSQSENQQRNRTPSSDDGLSSNMIDGVPVAPIRLKSKRRSSDRLNFPAMPDQTLQSPAGKAASPHRPRSGHVSGFMSRPNQEKLDVEPGPAGLRRASEAVLPSQTQLKPAVPKVKRHSAISGIFHPSSGKNESSSKASMSTGRKLPQIPSQPISPTRSRPTSMPGRTPPFNKSQAWTFAKGDMDIDSATQDSKPQGIQRKILMEEDEGDGDSYC